MEINLRFLIKLMKIKIMKYTITKVCKVDEVLIQNNKAKEVI